MSDALRLDRAPIIEAVVDIHCDLPPATDFAQLQDRAKQALSASYPGALRQITQQHRLRTGGAQPAEADVRQQVTGLQFRSADEKQVVQFRGEGYTFNRLAPYGSLDDYLPTIEWSWNVFRELTMPLQIRAIGLRYINRLLVPIVDRLLDLPAYLQINPLFPAPDSLEFVGFVNQTSAVQKETENEVTINIVTQPSDDDQVVPIILDIDASDPHVRDPGDWQGIWEAILSLRSLKNRVFERILTERCLNLFRQP